MTEYPYIANLLAIYNREARGKKRAPRYIVLPAFEFVTFVREMGDRVDSLPAYLRFIPLQPRFKGAYVFGSEHVNAPVFVWESDTL